MTDAAFDANVRAILKRHCIPEGRARESDLVNAKRVVEQSMGAMRNVEYRRMWKLIREWVKA